MTETVVTPAVVLQQVSLTYPDADGPALRNVDLAVDEGELCLVVGPTGSGKSTLLGLVNGLVPHFTGGTLSGSVAVLGRDTRDHRPRDLADLVGVVGQDPLAGFVTDTVEEELAYGMEQLALPSGTMRRRVEETLDLLGLAELRDRPLADLSGGQQQRVAIGSVLTTHPRVLVLDEPTSALDPTAAEEVLAAVTRLVHDLGVTVLLAEHRVERVLQYADRVVHVRDGAVLAGEPSDVMRQSSVAPPVVELGRLAGWSPLPLSVRDARRRAAPLRSRLRALRPDDAAASAGTTDVGRAGAAGDPSSSPTALRARGVVVRYGPVVAVAGVDLDLAAGQVTALMGRNGAGKSSLLWALQGSGRRQSGRVVDATGTDPADLPPQQARSRVGRVPQQAADLLYLETVADECLTADREAGVPAGTARALLDRMVPGVDPEAHPRDLSEGQRLALVLALVLVSSPSVLLLDEPTRGLVYPGKDALGHILRELAETGTTVLLATHDVEFVAAVAERAVVLADGEVVSEGPAPVVLGETPAFAPQVQKVLGPGWLTVDQVVLALHATDEARR
jgi:energy-coupling factor transport system ATP-binding protein